MSNVRQFTERLAGLDFSRMYEGDFFLTWEKTREELEAVFTVADALSGVKTVTASFSDETLLPDSSSASASSGEI